MVSVNQAAYGEKHNGIQYTSQQLSCDITNCNSTDRGGERGGGLLCRINRELINHIIAWYCVTNMLACLNSL